MSFEEIKKREEAKREAAYDPVRRWEHIQATITWAEANLTPEQRRNRPRWPKWVTDEHHEETRRENDFSGEGSKGSKK